MLDSGVDVLNGLSGMEHLSNSLVGRPLKNYGGAAYAQLGGRIDVKPDYAKKYQPIRESVESRENSRGRS